MSCDSTDPALLARDSRFLYDTDLERFTTWFMSLTLLIVLLAWTQYSSWHCEFKWGVKASRSAAFIASCLYPIARAMYISVPWETDLGSAAASSNLVFSLAAGAFAIFDSALALSFVLCPTRMGELVGDVDDTELKSLTDAAAKGKPLNTLPSPLSGASFLCNVLFKSCFMVSMALDIHVRCGVVVSALGWLAWVGCVLLWLRSFMGSLSFAPRRPRHGDSTAPKSRGRTPCISFTTNAVLAAIITALFVPVLILRPFSGY